MMPTFRISSISILVALLAFMGCTTTSIVTKDKSAGKTHEVTPEEFFDRVGGDQWEIKLATGKERHGTIVPVRGDSISLVSGMDSLALPMEQIQLVSRKHYLLGVLVYAPLGMLAGGLLGASVGQSTSGGNAGKFWGGYAGFEAGMAIGTVGGLLLGIFSPPETAYRCSDREGSLWTPRRPQPVTFLLSAVCAQYFCQMVRG